MGCEEQLAVGELLPQSRLHPQLLELAAGRPRPVVGLAFARTGALVDNLTGHVTDLREV